MNIAVIVDHLDEGKRRRCFWPEQLDGFQDQDTEYELVSMLELMVRRKSFDIYSYDIIIFNWCVLDGAVMYESDRLQNVVKFYDQHFFRFVRQKGGIVIFENQPKRWYPEQVAYDILLKDELEVLKENVPSRAEIIHVNQDHNNHPFVSELQGTIRSQYCHKSNDRWFPPNSTSTYSLRRLNPKNIYSGAFKWWRPSWLPLLYTEDRKYPVLLAKVDGEGLWIASTMFIASSNIRELISALVHVTDKKREKIRRYHEQHNRKRKCKILLGAGALVVFAAGVFFASKNGMIMITIPYSNTVPVSLLISTTASVLLWLVAKVLKLIYRRPRRRTQKA